MNVTLSNFLLDIYDNNVVIERLHTNTKEGETDMQRSYAKHNFEIPDGYTIERYKSDMTSIIERICPRLLKGEIEEAVEWAVGKSFQNHKVKVHNNYLDRTAMMDLLSLSDEILTQKPIITSQGVLFKRHGTAKNPLYNFIQYLCDMRDMAKAEMKKYKKGTKEYQDYNLKQLNYKVSCNAVYGCAGNWSSVFYNLYLCTAVTGQGRGCISASITMFESFLANNIKFASLTEVLQFIENITQDQNRPDNNRFKDANVLDRNVTVEECFLKLIRNCGYDSWVPSDEAVKAIWNTVNNLDQRCINIIYYKNNLYEFCSNSRVMNLIIRILVNLNKPYLDPNKIPDEIEFELNMLYDLLYEYVYYRHLYIDKLDRVYNLMREVVLLTDTDSCIITLDEWYKFVLGKTVGVPMKIKMTREEIKFKEEQIELEYQNTAPEYEYDFYNEKLVEAKRLQNICVIIEEDNLRYSIVNIMSHIISRLILDYMVLFSENYNTATEGRKCLLIMKNEFLFKTMLLTIGAKNYVDLQLVQEGNIIPEDKQLDIKGLPLNKITTPTLTSTALQDIIEYDVLRKSFIDQVDIFKKLVTLEKRIYKSIQDKKTEFHKPARIRSIVNYKNPMSLQAIKASYAYNCIKSDEEEGINLEEMNTVLIIKTEINKKNIVKIKDTFPGHYERLNKLLLENKSYKDGISSIAIPINITIPDWIIPFVNYNQIILDNIKIFPLDELGLSRLDSKYVSHSNIIRF